MIKIFNATDTDFKTAGNIIINPLHCHEIKKKSLNGWYIEVEIPIKYKEYIEADKLCVVKTKSKLKPQAFRINDSITYTNRKIKFTAEHVMFDSRRYVLLDARPTNLNGQNGLKYVNERTDKISPFSITSNVENVSTAYFIRKTLLESWQVFEERWGGVFEADNWNISFKQSIGKDNGETIVYGKNMQGFEIFEDWSNVCTKILPVGYDGLLLPEKYLESETQYEISYTKIVDFQTDLEAEEQTETNLLVELRNNASKYLEENCVPKVSYTVNSNVNNDLEIGDTIKVLHPFVNIFTEVLEYEYDLISEKVKSLTFGNYTRDVKTKFNNIKNTIETIKQTVSKQEITIKEQTNLINSLNKNGYVYIDDNEILILDQLPKEKAKNVWRFGLGGIGFSSKGYEGPFEIAITMDGKINADFITTGTMAVDRIEGLANFITDTSASIAAIELQQDSITTKVSSVEQSVENITNTEGEATGKNIHLEDSSDEPLVSIKVKGETNQATRSGKNKCKITISSQTKNGLDVVVNADKTILINGTATANTFILLSEEFNIPSGTYCLSGCPQGGSSSTYKLYLNAVSGQDLGEGKIITLSKEKNTYAVIDISEGVVCNNLLFKPQLEIGSTATEYEQYGTSPSPDYPSEIENVEGNIEIKSVGKNLLNVTAKTTTVQGLTFTVNEDKSITINGTNTGTGTAFLKLADIFVLPAGNYTLSNKKSNANINSFIFYDDKYNFVTKNISNATFTKDTTIKPYIRVKAGATVNNQTIYPMILKGTYTEENLPAYTPYQEQKVTFPLSEGQKLYEGSYLADDGIHNKRKQYVITGNETFMIQPQTNDTNLYVAINLPDLKTNGIVLSNYFSSGLSLRNNTNKIGALYSTYLYFGILLTIIGATSNDDSSTKIQKFKTWLATQYANGTPVIVEYELSEEEIVPYTTEQQEAWNKIEQLHTYKNVTNIFSDAELDIVYARDNGLSDMYETKQNAERNYTKTTEKLAEQKITTDSIQQNVSKTETIVANNYKELKTKFDDYAPKSDVITLQNSVEKIQTDTYTKTEINTKLIDGSVEKVSTTAGTFDENGMTIEKTNAKTKGNFNEKGMSVIDNTGSKGETLLFAGYDEELNETIVKSKNMIVEKYLVVGANSRFENYNNTTLNATGTGVFII